MSHLDPFNPPYETFTAQIGRQIRGLIGLMEQYQALHPVVKPLYIKRLKRMAEQWDQLPYPKEVEKKNDSYI